MHTASDRPHAAARRRTLRTSAWLRSLGLTLGLALASAQAGAATVFACEPEWAALVRVLLPQAKVHVATHARQDPHHIEARPALIAQMRSADLAVCTGAALEAGWLPMLQQRSANRKVQNGQPGMFYAADHASLIDPRPATLNPFAGDVHPEGNPHLHADPRRLAEVAEALAERIGEVWPAQAAEVQARHKDWAVRWQRHIERWSQQGSALKGRQVAAQHTTFGYLWHWLGIEMVADLEPKPGMPPTPGHLDSLRKALVNHPPAAIVVAAYQDERSARWLVQQLQGKVPMLVLPATVDNPHQAEALERWFDRLLSDLLATAGQR
ncbi:MAG: zinc ABC transporter substrate-binding protein [Hydrogenophaga sp.]|uniref:metal ABC transporter solute-binding protein, Zn/Mn family n=1 Tax=Hydrogenophaga sp. TaxID=1904254 RepID=UPI00275239CB|nr:zinc ABC transporter substrate-binding protein [Hydrogenophaga sp.]MDP2416142.1 zinc ABC transporter substrate-binding protein [Hydrogenophaga sp.]MDZ4187305.1 zinc ABC transporter substrate-binding protein [Hydrogenophaga sp.]